MKKYQNHALLEKITWEEVKFVSVDVSHDY